jgi:exonuclease III
MNTTRNWKIITWNVRGINSQWKWSPVRNKVTESQCDIVCLQETKKEVIDGSFLKNICPSTLDCFDYLPSNGASGGILMIWKSSMFTATRVSSNDFSITLEFCSEFNRSKWKLICIYAPCTPEGKTLFLDWFKNMQIENEEDYLVLGDFNLIRTEEDRNKPGGTSMTCSDLMQPSTSWESMKLFYKEENTLGLICNHPHYKKNWIGFSPQGTGTSLTQQHRYMLLI